MEQEQYVKIVNISLLHDFKLMKGILRAFSPLYLRQCISGSRLVSDCDIVMAIKVLLLIGPSLASDRI